jgi:hypothetical protein
MKSNCDGRFGALSGLFVSVIGWREGRGGRKGSDQHNSLISLVLDRKIEVIFALKLLFACINGGL